MKCRITFEVEPNTTYVYKATSLDDARYQAYELARRLNRDAWMLEFGGDVLRFRSSGISFVQVA